MNPRENRRSVWIARFSIPSMAPESMVPYSLLALRPLPFHSSGDNPMSIVLDKARTVALWYALINKDVDLLGCIQTAGDDYKELPTHYIFDYRFRYYRDDNVFHSQDEKHWYRVKMVAPSREAVLAKVRSILERLMLLAND